ncbi:ATP-binding cassette domain-containing protein [bacterium]|nr:ATP-binding cassette domain-containing protein [bacterium]
MNRPPPSTGMRMVQYLVPHRGALAVAIFCMVLFAFFHAFSIWTIKPVLDKIFTPTADLAVTLPYFGWRLEFDRLRLLLALSVFVSAVFFIKSAAQFGQEYLMTRVGHRILQKLRNDLFKKYTQMPMEFLEGERAGKLISVSLNDVGLVYGALIRVVTDTILQPIVIVFLVSLAFTLAPVRLSLIAFLVFPLIGGLIALFGRKMKRATHGAQSQIEDLTQRLTEKIGGMKIVRIFGQEDAERGRYAREVEGYFRWSMKQARISSMSGPLMVFLGGIGAAFAIYYGGYLVVTGELTGGSFFAFMACVISSYKPVKHLTNLYNIYQQGEAAAERIFGFLDAPESPDLDAGRPAVFERDLSFHGVGFVYDGTRAEVLKDITFAVRRGERVAFVGMSGAGKSTLMMLIPRLIDPTAGSIALDGTSLCDLAPRSLRSLLATVTQDIVLFNDSALANILYGRPDAARAEAEEAARAAYAHDFIAALPKGYDTVLGDRGSKLSGGQRQRIAIARAFLKNAPILILDEATSSLDSESEREVQAALERLSAGRTTLIVAHRLSTVKTCDRIFVMQDGRIIDAGLHDELMSRCAVYRTAVSLQSL